MRINFIYIVGLVLAFSLASCIDDEPIMGTGCGVEGDSPLQFAVRSFDEGTRSAEPSNDPEPENDDERKIENFWLFQFNPDDGRQLAVPKYYSIPADGATLNEMTAKAYTELKRNTPMTIYVVANISNSTWATGDGFDTLDKVKAQAIPSPFPIQVGDDSNNDGVPDDILIPMSGELKDITVLENTLVVVPVTRMYAKIKIQASFPEADMKLYYADINGIPWYCRVSPLVNGNDPNNGEPMAVPFPEETVMIPRAFKSDDAVESNGERWLIIYVPENIRGEIDNADKSTNTNIPEKALTIKIRAKLKGSDYFYTVYPGENEKNNFNIRRNCVYRVTVDVTNATDQHNPSANCFIVEPGDQLSFEPYNRVETGGGYRIEDYLNPDDESRRIEKIEIVWQTKDCIGDNTDGKLVYLGPDTKDKHRKIIVHTQKEGNALIAARNSDGDIVWSWHIWVTPNQPDNFANAHTYTTYRWDKTKTTIKVKVDSVRRWKFGTGFYWEYTYEDREVEAVYPLANQRRVPGPAVMNCNLGALGLVGGTSELNVGMATNLFSEKEYRTFGMVYQWGRKDPFPPVIRYTGGNNDSGSASSTPGYLNYTTLNTGEHYANDNKTVVEKTGEVVTSPGNYLFYSVNSNNLSERGITYAIKHPTVYIACTNVYRDPGTREFPLITDLNNRGDWLPNGQSDDKLWGGLVPDMSQKHMDLGRDADGNEIYMFDNYGDKKSVFDPCPYGWRVSSNDLWLGFTKTGLNPDDYGFTANNLPSANNPHYDDFWGMPDVNWERGESGMCGMMMYMQAWRYGEKSYFPLQGTRIGKGWWFNNGWCGNYHNATCSRNNRVNILHLHLNPLRFHLFEISNREYYIKSTASPVRCVRETK